MTRRCVGLATLVRTVNHPQARNDVKSYFSTRGDGLPRFTGARFDTLSRTDGDRDVITAADIVAVQTLSVVIPSLVAVDLLEGPLGRAIGDLLTQIPADVELGTSAAAEHIADGSRADQAWKLLKQSDGIGWVIAGKVLARKRPKLVPIYDAVIRCVFRSPKKFWQCLDGRLQENEGELRRALVGLRADTSTPANISDIRLLDIVLWMRHRPEHGSYGCPGIGSE